MARKAETTFSARVRKDLEKLEKKGVLWFVKIQQVGIRGTPDYLINANGHFVALELKREAGISADPLQTYNLNRIESSNGYAYTTEPSNWESVYKAITRLCKS